MQRHRDPRLYDDFRVFLWHIWRHLDLPDPTPVQYDIAHYLQHGPRRRMVQAFRGVGKSWITAAYVLWLLYRDPQCRIMVVSASKERAAAFSTFVRRLIEDVPELRWLQPKDGSRDSVLAFDVGPAAPDQAPSVRACGITGQLTGGRADVIVPDDIEVPKNSATETMRIKLGELVKEFDAILKPGGQIVFLGTPQSEQSVYRKLEERGYECRIWPARFPNEEQRDRYGSRLAPLVSKALDSDASRAGKSTEPTRFSDFDLMEREASYGRSGFALQFMLDTTLSDAEKYPLKLSDLIVMDVDSELAPVRVTWASGPEQRLDGLPNVGFDGDRYYSPMFVHKDFVPFQGCVMTIDPAGRGKDEATYAVVKMLNGTLYLVDAGGFLSGYDDPTLMAMARIAKKHKVNHIRIESNFGDGMFTKLFEPVLNRIHPCTVEEERSTGQKEARIIDTLEPVLNQHRLVIDKKLVQKDYESVSQYAGDAAGNYRLLYQLTHLTRDRGSLVHDDRVDALAMAVAYWIEALANDSENAERQHRERLLDDELRRFMDSVGVLGASSGSPLGSFTNRRR